MRYIMEKIGKYRQGRAEEKAQQKTADVDYGKSESEKHEKK